MNLETIKLITEPILRRHGAVKAAIFGSLARGDQHPDSDVDILVEYARDKAVSLFDHIALTEELKAILKCNVESAAIIS
ncbi:MAG: nucleotidyltransferase family protein [Desulfurispora sp.]|uniref:nucleotidyltransferase family protein n=1 Tax=Desulfurispora sp. TaxID=3014275 RepID=UPI00404A082C